MKKLLILGAMETHVPLISRAKELGIYTITCDYLLENPGHKIAHEACFVSTTDENAVLSLAKYHNIDGIMTYNSDPAALTVAYVAEKLGLPGNPYNSVKIMSEKNSFRKFLYENDLNFPHFWDFKTLDEVKSNINKFKFPVIVKPVDSSGSKGCTVVDSVEKIEEAVEFAISKSRSGKFIIEEYIEPKGCQLHGDGFVENGRITFLYLGDHHFDADLNNLVPYSTTYPTSHNDCIVEQCRNEIQNFISKVGFKNGGFNVELRVSKKDEKIYIIDIGARNGGNFTPKVIEYGSGFNFMDRAIKLALGETLENIKMTDKIYNFVSHLILHAKRHGVLNNCVLSDELEKHILEKHMYLKSGDKIEPFLGANTALGILIMQYDSRKQMNYIVENFESLYTVLLETSETRMYENKHKDNIVGGGGYNCRVKFAELCPLPESRSAA